MKIAKPLADLIDSLEQLPGIGPRSAQRLAYYLLHVPQSQLTSFADALENLKKKTVLCEVCKNVSETDPCPICDSAGRDASQILVVEQPLDVIVFEKTGKYKGLYHVLHGSINPLENIGPDEIYIADLLKRAGQKNGHSVSEIIIATNPTMEGEATAMYIRGQVEEIDPEISVTRLGMGIPTGAYLEFADENTLMRAYEGRRSF